MSIVLISVPCTSILGQEQDSQQERKRERLIEHTGDLLMFGLPMVAGSATLFKEDKEGTKQFIRSLAFNLAMTTGIKFAINKPRPEGATDGHAFPSGHTSTSFHAASFIQSRYGWKYGGPAYIMAAFVGWSRLEADRHDEWDVLGGALLGMGSTYLFTSPLLQSDNLNLSYNGSQVHISYTF
jgi:hypothetical protein